jgi:hypothetical protein
MDRDWRPRLPVVHGAPANKLYRIWLRPYETAAEGPVMRGGDVTSNRVRGPPLVAQSQSGMASGNVASNATRAQCAKLEWW